jgi:plasmid stabilization system protein ParE
VTFTVRFSRGASDDLERLYDFLLERELASDTADLDLPERALTALREGLALLQRFPFTCRKAQASPFLRELVIPFGHTGYVVLFEVVDQQSVEVAAVRHQREDDYH